MLRFKLPDFKDPTVRFQMTLYGGALAIVALFGVSAALPLASNPGFCGKACHNMNPEYQSWQRSSHAKITCYACHVSPSYPQLVKEKFLLGPLGIVQTLFNSYEKPINGESKYALEDLPSVRCERCHANENRRFTFSRGIYMNHKAHKEAGIQCPICHNRVVHKDAEKYEPIKSEWGGEARDFRYKNFLTMKQGCFRCHDSNPGARDKEALAFIKNGKTPPGACTTCHTRDFKLPVGHASATWRSGHGDVARQNFDTCFRCHDAGAKFDNDGRPWCTVCHDGSRVDSFKLERAAQQAQ